MKYNNGDIYDGNWINDKRNGKGKLILKMKILYIMEIGKMII